MAGNAGEVSIMDGVRDLAREPTLEQTQMATEDEMRLPFWFKLRKLVTGSLNFYRVHMLYFIIVSPSPLPIA